MEVRPGYKRTEVGIIPDEWEAKPLGDIFEFSRGFTASREQLSSKGHCYLHYGDIHKSGKIFIDVQAEFLDIPKLEIPLNRVSSRSILNDGDVVFVDASEDDEGTSKHIVVINKPAITYISGLHTIVAKSKDRSLDNHFKQFCFQTADIKRQFYFYAVGTKVSGISKTNISKLFLPLPPLTEQRAIATVLGDVDALIDALTNLIAKKRDLKQAALQQLLTGQTRLPGFDGEWDLKRLSDVFSISTGTSKSAYVVDGGRYWVVDMGSVSRAGRLIVSKATDFSGDFLKVGDLVMPKDDIGGGGIIGKVGYIDAGNTYVLGDHIYCLKAKEGNPIFLSYLINSNQINMALRKKVIGSAQLGLARKSVEDQEIPYPTSAEQTSIASVLSDMEADIVALEARQAKVRRLKQGMMQELLTGRIRLI